MWKHRNREKCISCDLKIFNASKIFFLYVSLQFLYELDYKLDS